MALSDAIVAKDSKHPITLRAVLIGLIFVVLLCGITPYNNDYLQNARIAGNHLPVGSIFVLLFLVFCINAPLHKLAPRWALTASELTTIWIMLIATLAIPGVSFMEILFPQLVSLAYFASPENEWATTLQPHIPDWLVITEPGAVRDFFEGTERFGMVPWAAWIRPLGAWGLFMFAFYFTLYCLSTIIRRQWSERERFSFPLIQVPLGVVSGPDPGAAVNRFIKNRLLLLGAFIPVLVHLMNGLHSHIPSIPEIPLVYRLYEAFTEKPFHVLGWGQSLRIMVFFSVIGVAYLLTLEISFSLWVFFLLFKVEQIFLEASGLRPGGGFFNRQVMGGYLVFIVAILWTSREHLRSVFQQIFTTRSTVDDSDEPLAYRTAAVGFIVGSCGLVLLCVLAGYSPWIGAVSILIALIMSVVLSWFVVNAGLLRIQAPFMPWQYIHVVGGISVIDTRSLALSSFQRGIWRHWSDFVMPHYLHSFRAAGETKLARRRLLAVIALASLVGYGISVYARLNLAYDEGALNLRDSSYVSIPRWFFGWINGWVQNPQGREFMAVHGMASGGLLTLFLVSMRHRFLWWSLHPIGFLLGNTPPAGQLWSCILVGWLVKRSILRFSGVPGYRRLRPFFLGLILGEYLMVGFWMIIGYFTKIGYSALPT